MTAELVEHALEHDAAGLDEAHRLAVRFADDLMTRPGDISDATVAGLRRHFDERQLVELTLKVLKFNVQKVKVALRNHRWMTASDLDTAAWNQDGAFVAAADVHFTT